MAGFFSSVAPILGAGAVGLMSGGLRADRSNPADAGMRYLNQIPRATGRYMQPFIDRGFQAEHMAPTIYNKMIELYQNAPNYLDNVSASTDELKNLYRSKEDLYANPQANPDLYLNHGIDYQEMPEQYRNMARTPQEFMNEIMRGYEPSRGYQFRENRLRQQARNTAASGGFAGTRADQEQQTEMVNDILNNDMQKYLDTVLGIQGQGLAGEERRIGRLQSGLEKMLLGRERHQDRTLQGRTRHQEFGLEGQRQLLGNELAVAQARQGAMENRLAGINDAMYRQAVGQENLSNRGFEAARGMAATMGNNLSSQATLGMQGAMQQRMAQERARENRMNLITSLLGAVGGRMAMAGGG